MSSGTSFITMYVIMTLLFSMVLVLIGLVFIRARNNRNKKRKEVN